MIIDMTATAISATKLKVEVLDDGRAAKPRTIILEVGKTYKFNTLDNDNKVVEITGELTSFNANGKLPNHFEIDINSNPYTSVIQKYTHVNTYSRGVLNVKVGTTDYSVTDLFVPDAYVLGDLIDAPVVGWVDKAAEPFDATTGLMKFTYNRKEAGETVEIEVKKADGTVVFYDGKTFDALDDAATMVWTMRDLSATIVNGAHTVDNLATTDNTKIIAADTVLSYTVKATKGIDYETITGTYTVLADDVTKVTYTA